MVLLLVVKLTGRSLRPAAPLATIGIGLVQVAGFMLLQTWALVEGGPGKTAVLIFTMPIWTLLLARLFLKEDIRPGQWVAAFCALTSTDGWALASGLAGATGAVCTAGVAGAAVTGAAGAGLGATTLVVAGGGVWGLTGFSSVETCAGSPLVSIVTMMGFSAEGVEGVTTAGGVAGGGVGGVGTVALRDGAWVVVVSGCLTCGAVVAGDLTGATAGAAGVAAAVFVLTAGGWRKLTTFLKVDGWGVLEAAAGAGLVEGWVLAEGWRMAARRVSRAAASCSGVMAPGTTVLAG